MLAEFRLIPGLNNLFDKLIWRKFTSSNHVVHGQNENCDCSPVCTSFLLLVKSLLQFPVIRHTKFLGFFFSCRKYPSKSSSCDSFKVSVITTSKDPFLLFFCLICFIFAFVLIQPLSFRNKYLLLNSQELNELSAISMKANIPEVEALVNTDRSLVCDGKKGLLTRLLAVMKREPPDSSFRWE